MHIHMSQKEVSLVMPQIKQLRVRNDSELCEVCIPDIYQHTIQRDEIKMVFYAKFRHPPISANPHCSIKKFCGRAARVSSAKF